MEMTIDDAMNHIKYGIIEGNYPLPKDLGVEACNIAIDTMFKYQRIQKIVKFGNKNELGFEYVGKKITEVIEDGKIY